MLLTAKEVYPRRLYLLLLQISFVSSFFPCKAYVHRSSIFFLKRTKNYRPAVRGMDGAGYHMCLLDAVICLGLKEANQLCYEKEREMTSASNPGVAAEGPTTHKRDSPCGGVQGGSLELGLTIQ
uniref:Secreted protein n=1 Tax=Steinernema glaseri TaxID=37863 RepID=A0A1I7Z0L3_9BILA